MSIPLPGLNVTSESDQNAQTVNLEPGSEWRFEVEATAKLVLRLKTGTAEIFGTELPVGNDFTFIGTKAAVFSWHGATIEYTCSKSDDLSEYTSDETPMTTYANLHFALESQRCQHKPPNVLVLGPPDSGKTSLCKILCSYANKGPSQRYPVYVNLDPTEGVFSTPGGLSAAPISDILDVEDVSGWGVSQMNGPALLHPKNPLVYFYGLDNPTKNKRYYKKMISRLALGVAARMANDKRVRGSGIVIDTPGTGLIDEKEQGYSTISSIVADFDVNVIVVVGQERLYSEMSKKFSKSTKRAVTVLKVPKSGGAVDRTAAYLRQLQSRSIQEYFYGSPKQLLAPYTVTVSYSVITVYRVAEHSDVNNLSVLPAGEGNVLEEEQEKPKEKTADAENEYLVKLEPSTILQNCVMAVLNANPGDSIDTLVQSEVLGYVHVVEADDTKKYMKVLMPVPGRLPNRPFVIGDYRYHE
ncbi:mRNA cleavage and polyadenylation factor Clp1p [Trichomonascus vanleenenianus]|uniref:cleavage polyadenylation factor subunit CLP1 n=1 Tax=Trichomonascus vanleenenianus TaxID=2268995 RepID=UPI003ECA2B81